ncbi:MAG: hypothetical protein KDL31_04405 [Kiritimatiellae bacterium]|nr:hypothetical protein [Kiritimatiellia bacterium]MCB1100992.1 hypothetical protein [Kiritimatiellia bacterium]
MSVCPTQHPQCWRQALGGLLLLVVPVTGFAQTNFASPPTVSTTLLSTAWSEPAWVADIGVELTGTAGDDVFVAAANQALIDGRFSNSVWAVGSDVQLRGIVGDHVRIAAIQATVNADIANSLTAATIQRLDIATNTTIHGALYAMGQTVTSLAAIDGPVKILSKKATLGGTLKGDVWISADDIVILPHTHIQGDLTYLTTNRDLVLAQNVVVEGTVRRGESFTPVSLSWQTLLLLQGYLLLSGVMVGIPFMLIFPLTLSRAVHLAQTRIFHCGLVGSLSILLVPLLTGVALMSVLGIPLALVLGASYAVILYLGRFVIALWLGSKLLRQHGHVTALSATLALIIGLVIFYAVSILPGIGSMVSLVMTLYGTGSLLILLVRPRVMAIVKNPQPDQRDTEINQSVQ